MSERPIDAVLRELRRIHNELWDPNAELVRLAPGTNPGVDASEWNLHSVRDTALGSVIDLRDGNVDRAAPLQFRSVLANQYLDKGNPWSGTFKVCAEEHAPDENAVEWLHYDPNWRQFIGCILAYVLERHAAALSSDLAAEMHDAISRCVHGEPTDRIASWYTNPNLMHAWLTSWLGVRSRDRGLTDAGETRLRRTMERFTRYGDVDEYNSPTYDGVDLFAAALWVSLPPTPRFAAAGAELATHIGNRLAHLYHPGLGAICGPYIRAYGLAMDRYVALAGEWLALAGADVTRVMPSSLSIETDHVHDLFFLALFDDLADVIVPHVTIGEVEAPRRHEQRFGDVLAVSYLDSTWAVGAERGRIPNFSTDQYVPFTAHYLMEGALAFLAVKMGAETRTIDAIIDDERTASVTPTGIHDNVDVILVCSTRPTVQNTNIELGPLTLTFSAPPTSIVAEDRAGDTQLHISWDQPHVTMRARLNPPG